MARIYDRAKRIIEISGSDCFVSVNRFGFRIVSDVTFQLHGEHFVFIEILVLTFCDTVGVVNSCKCVLIMLGRDVEFKLCRN